jgi:hypothetical protein
MKKNIDYINITGESEFIKLIKGLSDDIIQASIYYKLRMNFYDLMNYYIVEINNSNTFWRYTIGAVEDAILYRLFRIYDAYDQKEVLNLKNWLGTINENIHFFDVENFKERLKDNPFVESLANYPRKPDEKQLEEDINFCKKNKLVIKLKELRNEYYIHKNAQKFLKGKKINNFIDLDDIGKLIDKAKEILNRYSSLFHAQDYSDMTNIQEELKFVLDCIKSYIKQKNAMIDREIKELKKKLKEK